MFTGFETRHPRLAFKLPAVAYMAVIVGMSSIPGHDLPDLGLWSFDKVVHAIEFGLLGILLYRALRFPRPVWRPYLLTLLIGIPFAALDEIHQLFVPGRFCDIYDFLMDVAGIVLFAGISARIHGGRTMTRRTP